MKKLTQLKTLYIANGQFICITEAIVFVALLNENQQRVYWDALALADDSLHPVDNRKYVMRRAFGDDVLRALPANSITALMDYAENYTGLQEEHVKGLAACILTGTPFGFNDTPDGGSKEPQQPAPTKRPPSGAKQIPTTLEA